MKRISIFDSAQILTSLLPIQSECQESLFSYFKSIHLKIMER